MFNLENAIRVAIFLSAFAATVLLFTTIDALKYSNANAQVTCQPADGVLSRHETRTSQVLSFQGTDARGFDLLITMDREGNWTIFTRGPSQTLGDVICKIGSGTAGMSVVSGQNAGTHGLIPAA